MMGTTVILSHGGGYETVYANLQSKPTVAKGEVVSAGQIIGAVGSTSIAEAAEGPHLHFSVTKGGELVDPQEFLKR
jgi:murein DD-endopeptidase MepM/ murein hydrolase activator NlpD